MMALHGSLRSACTAFDALRDRWEAHRTQQRIGSLLVVAFIASLAVIEANRRGALPATLAPRVATSHFAAIGIVFTLLLLLEVVGLVFALARSVADSVGKQFELLSLIFLRKAFFEFARLGEPLEWGRVVAVVRPMLADMGAALAVFVAVELYYRVQRHRAITAREDEQASFVCGKKVLALALLATFVVLGLLALRHPATGAGMRGFFEVFYTALVFSDVLIVLISLRYSSDYRVVFRNSGFAAATILIRLALTAPEYVDLLLGLGAALFTLALSVAYNACEPGGRTPLYVATSAAGCSARPP